MANEEIPPELDYAYIIGRDGFYWSRTVKKQGFDMPVL
jgi:hypothetical protein